MNQGASFSLLLRRAWLALAAISILTAGCKAKAPEEAAPVSDSVSLFTKDRGVWFSDETKKLFGLEVQEVTQRSMARRVRKTAQVYRGGRDGALARAMLWLNAAEADALKVGQRLSLVTGEGTEIAATLVRLERQTQTVFERTEGLIEFPDPQQCHPAGAFVTATWTNGAARPALAVPDSALLVAADGRYVYAVNGTHLTRTRVKTGVAVEGFVEIEEGLYEGDFIVTRGVDELWLVELSALKGGTPCCPVPKKDR